VGGGGRESGRERGEGKREGEGVSISLQEPRAMQLTRGIYQ